MNIKARLEKLEQGNKPEDKPIVTIVRFGTDGIDPPRLLSQAAWGDVYEESVKRSE